ncbi:MAG: DUF2199 domain-containing protein [Bacteroidota bacterium]
MEKFTCSTCGKNHNMYTVFQYGLPKAIVDDLLNGTLKNESSDRWMIISNQYFLIRGEIRIPVKNLKQAEFLSFLSWIMVDYDDFKKYIDCLERNSNSSYKHHGTLVSEIHGFAISSGLKVVYEFQGISRFPLVTIEKNETEISKAQVEGWDKKQYLKFLKSFYHPDQANISV